MQWLLIFVVFCWRAITEDSHCGNGRKQAKAALKLVFMIGKMLVVTLVCHITKSFVMRLPVTR